MDIKPDVKKLRLIEMESKEKFKAEWTENFILNNRLQHLINEIKNSSDSKICRTIIETLLKIFRNVATYPRETKYRQICIDKLQEGIWSTHSARQIFFLTGWQQKGEYVLLLDDQYVKMALDVLIKNRVLNPSESNFKTAAVEGPGRAAELEMKKKELAMKERDKELKECLDDKKKREELAELVKQEHAADRRRFNLLYKRNSE